jgi:hypothetical protein
VTEWVSDRLVRLPFFNDLAEPDQERVIQAVLEFTARPAHSATSECARHARSNVS